MTRVQQSSVVTLTPGDRTLSALLRLPMGFDPNECYPAIIYAHGQTLQPSSRRRYDELLGNAAFVSLTLATDGDERTDLYQQNIRSAMDYLRGYPFIDPERIGVIGLASGAPL
ncbi:hypothetical protein ABE484_04520 [Pseudomonas pudica]|uniref:hypothetical protein n=1 Tax=Pseudomonas pudica TaxID=272772 RepID=UPI0032097EE1